MVDRVFAGALSLLSVLVAVFTFAFIQLQAQTGRPEAAPYEVIVWLSGVLTMLTGICSIWSHIALFTKQYWPLHVLFTVVLFLTTALPVIFALANR